MAALGLAPFALSVAHAAPSRSRFITCAKRPDGTYTAVVFDDAGKVHAVLPLPERGHGAAISPDGTRAVVFGRRPADFMVAFATSAPSAAMTLRSAEGRHFYGHGCFSQNGKLLFTTENDFDNARGVVGIYDAADRFQKIGEVASGGVGPHEIILLRDGKTLAIANGGIETHPDFPRSKLNLATMAPNLTYLDAGSGTALDQVQPPAELHQLSLRHIAQTADGEVWIGGQYEGPASRNAPLIATHRRGEELTLITSPAPTAALKNYVGSVAVSGDGQLVGLTSPRGGVLQVWRAADGTLLSQTSLTDVCGVIAAPDGFVASDGRGRLWHNASLLAEESGWSWDNHISS